MFDLRPYQHLIIDETRDLMSKGVRSILVQSPTGSGKTVLVAHMLRSAASKGMGSWFNVHRIELVDQSIRTFEEMEIEHGVISASYMESIHPLVQICSIGTLANRYGKYKRPRLIIWDECHHLGAASWAKIFNQFPDAFHIGLTATPERLDGKGLGDKFKAMVRGPSVRELIDQGYLSKYKLYAPSNVSMAGVHTRMGDFVKSDLSVAFDKPSITGDAIREYQSKANGRRAVVFAVSIDHSQHIVSQFQAAGIRAKHVDGETNRDERRQAILDFRSGKLDILSNVDLFGEGFDVPAIEGVIDLAPTLSLGRFLQRAGRMLRPAAGKEFAFYLDHAGNCQRHGMPCEDRTWSLDGREQSRRTTDQKSKSVKVCPKCFAAQFPGKTACIYCFEPFEIQAREIEEREGELEEMSPEQLQQLRDLRHQEQAGAQTMDQLIALGKKRGYKRPHFWAKMVFQNSQGRKLKRQA